ncbi:cytoglobin-1-like [Osmerus mordax]|uniref:cytoglobin-1-like n=1 Tax=Osmerus mordax TaxID=8014 RepID=UPI003510BFF8
MNREQAAVELPDQLSETERGLVQESWSKVYQHCEDAGVAILVRLFQNYPDSKQYFPQFQHMQEAGELQTSALLRRHARRVMSAINTLVENIHNGDKMASVLLLVGRSHALKHKVEPVYFKYLNSVILEVLGEEYPDYITPEVGGAWTKLLASIYWHVTCVYEELAGGV